MGVVGFHVMVQLSAGDANDLVTLLETVMVNEFLLALYLLLLRLHQLVP